MFVQILTIAMTNDKVNRSLKVVATLVSAMLTVISLVVAGVVGSVIFIVLQATVLHGSASLAQGQSACGAVADQSIQAGIKLPPRIPAVYAALFAKAATAKNADVGLLTTIFWKEHGENFPNPPAPYGTGLQWASSGPGAAGPFQFMPSTWTSFGVDATHKGFADVEDLTDASYAAAGYLVALGGKAGTPLGDPSHPYQKGTLVNVMASYNGGPAGNFYTPETSDYYHSGYDFYRTLLGSGLAQPVIQATACTQPGPNTVTVGSLTASGTAAQLAAKLLADPNYRPLKDSSVRDDLLLATQDKPINNKYDCYHDTYLNADLLQLMINTTESPTHPFVLEPINLITGHDCDGLLHPKGRATDIDFATDLTTCTRPGVLSTCLQTNFCSSVMWKCDPSGDNQQVDAALFMTLGSLAPPRGIGLGQDTCPGRAGLNPPRVDHFFDSCNHQHIDMRNP